MGLTIVWLCWIVFPLRAADVSPVYVVILLDAKLQKMTSCQPKGV